MVFALLLLLVGIFGHVSAISKAKYYLPGVTAHHYVQYEGVKLLVSGLTSIKTQIPYDYYSLPFCKPSKYHLEAENLGEVLSGDRIENSVYKVNPGEIE